jgi:hypothetical protein
VSARWARQGTLSATGHKSSSRVAVHRASGVRSVVGGGRITSACSERAIQINVFCVGRISASLMRGVIRLPDVCAFVQRPTLIAPQSMP